MNKLPYLNLGCGSTYSEQWTNLDFVSNSEHVIAHNILNGIPSTDKTYEVVYHSHMLEHLPKKDALSFIKECYRVLKSGGIIRVVVPNLEQIALNYIKYLNDATENKTGADKKYEWTILEMFDQVVREKSGGEMVEYITDTTKNNDDFLIERNGKEVELIMKDLRNQTSISSNSSKKKSVFSFNINRSKAREALIKLVLGKNYANYKISQFRKQGEIHQWMYDRYSLKNLLKEAGFKEIEVKTAFTSSIPNWNTFKLDGENNRIRKPDSLFMEAIK